MKRRHLREIKGSPAREILGGTRPIRPPLAVSLARRLGVELFLDSGGEVRAHADDLLDSDQWSLLGRAIAEESAAVREYLAPWACEGCGTALSVPEHFCGPCDAAARLLGAVAIQGSGMPHAVREDSRTICRSMRVRTETPEVWPMSLCWLCRLAIETVRRGQQVA